MLALSEKAELTVTKTPVTSTSASQSSTYLSWYGVSDFATSVLFGVQVTTLEARVQLLIAEVPSFIFGEVDPVNPVKVTLNVDFELSE